MNAYKQLSTSCLLLCFVACQSESKSPAVAAPEVTPAPSPAPAVASFMIDDGGYVTSGSFHGYAWTWAAEGAVINPTDFSTVVAGGQLCASGLLPVDPTYNHVAQLGFDVNQAQQGPDSVSSTMAPSGNGIRVRVTNRGKSPLRVTLSGANGETDPNDWWCAALPTESAVIPWSAFNTACWDGSGTAYAGQPLRVLGILVPSSAGSATSFDFCLDELADSTTNEAAPETIDQFIERTIHSVGMPGVQTAVVKNGQLVWAKSYGMAVTAPFAEKPMTNDTVLELASISKELVAIAFMQQVEAGSLGLDDDVSQSLPWQLRNPNFPDLPITWRMILSHTAGLNDDARAFDDFVLGMDSPIALADFLRDVYSSTGRYYGEGTFLAQAPGASYRYSVFAMALAAYAVELKALQPFSEYVSARILQPLGMASSGYFLRDFPTDVLAVGYTCDPSAAGFACVPAGDPLASVLEQQHSVPYYPTVLLRAPAAQYTKLMAMMMNGGKAGDVPILTPASITQLLTPVIDRSSGGRQGLAFFSTDATGSIWGHSGVDQGVASAAFFDPTSGIGAIAVGNAQNSAQTNTNEMTQIVNRLLSELR
jgi:CubicO group peptidase (beta-lactamase class C family)